MKLYIFLTSHLYSIGGQQIYVASKSKWLESEGYHVHIIATTTGKISIKHLEKYKKNIFKELQILPQWFTSKRRKRITNKIIKNINPTSTSHIIIESTNQILCVWGEIIAEKIQAKHIFYSIQEENSFQSKDLSNFLYFKHHRNELAGIKQEAFKSIFKNNWTTIPTLMAYMDNQPKDYKHQFSAKILPATYTIGLIGRLSKPFVFPVMTQIHSYVQLHHNDRFNLLLIGGSTEKEVIKAIKKLFRKTRNLSLYITGYMHPIPQDLIDLPDVFISNAGSSRISAESNKITIPIDTQDHNPIGVLGITTQNTIYRNENEPIISLHEILDDVLYKKKYNYKDIKQPISLFNLDYSTHINFVYNSSQNKLYYNFNFEFKDKVKKTIFNLFLLKHNNFPRLTTLFKNLEKQTSKIKMLLF